MNNTAKLLITLLMVSTAPAAFASEAQPNAESNDNQPDIIIVTAQRREQNLQDVPVSITAISAETLRSRSTRDVSEAIAFAPNVAVTAGPNGGDDGGFFIRGVGQLDNSIAVDPGVGVYVDDIYIARLQAASVNVLDLERLEVLRGPQGTLFGRNTIGGAISLITAQPDFDKISVAAIGTYGSRERADFSAAVNVPISDVLAVRATGFTRNQRGWGRNVFTGDSFGNINDIGGRLKLRFEPLDTFSVTLAGDYLRGRGSPSHQILLGVNPNAGIRVPRPPAFGGPFFRPGVSPTGVPFPVGLGNDRSPNRRLNFASVPARNDVDTGGVSLNITGDMGGITLKSITGWRRYNETTFNDFDATGFVLYDNSSVLRQQQISQEVQFSGRIGSRIEFLGGLYYFGEDASNLVELCTGTNQPRLVNRCIRSRNNIALDVESFAAFGQASWDITDRLNLFAGLRWTTETKTQQNRSVLDNTDRILSVLPPPPMGGIPAPGRTFVALPFTQVNETFTAFTPRVGFNYALADQVKLYGSYSEGFKSGGFNGRPSSAMILPFDPETVQAFEAGVKAEFFDRLLRVNASVFQSDYTDQQLLVFTARDGLFETRNAGDSRIRGAELEVDANISERFTLRGSVGYLDARYLRLTDQVANVTLDTPLPLTPEWTYSVSGEYRQPLGDDRGELRFRADWQYRSEVSFQLEADPLERQPGYGLLNLRTSWVLPDDRFQIAAFGTNVTGTRYLTNAQDTLAGNGTAFGGVGRPAEWGIELGVRF